MTESSQIKVKHRAVLIARGNELSEFTALLKELDVPIDVRRGGMPTLDDVSGAAIAVVLGRRLVEGGTPNLARWPRTIAVVDGSSKTLVAHLARMGVALVIRRPIHPRTLRLLLLHEIYRGPERRTRKRTLIGHVVRAGSGLFKQRATLLELSPTGARIEMLNPPKVGGNLNIVIGKDLTLGKPLKLQTRVKRCIRSSANKAGGEHEIGVALVDPVGNAKAIRAILDRFVSGPASWNGKLAATETPRPTSDSDQHTAESPPIEAFDPSESARRLPPSISAAARAPAAPTTPAETPRRIEAVSTDPDFESNFTSETNSADISSDASDSFDRRSDPRVPYDKRVVALGDEAARVLVGRDLSQGGMRIARNESVEIGDVLRIALHSGTEAKPLIVLANVLRDDGEDGTVLTFQNLSNKQRDQLDQVLANSSPIHARSDDASDCDDGGEAIVLGEVLETIDSEEAIEAHLDSIFDTGEPVEHSW